MSEQLDAVLQQMSELVNTVKEHGGTGDLDKESIVESFKGLLNEQKAALLAEMPIHAGEIGSSEEKAIEAYQGKYRSELKEIFHNGYARTGNWKLRGSDLFIAKMLMDRAVELKFANAKPASDDLSNAVKALTATGAGTGDELVPTGMASELWSDFFAASQIANDLPSQPMPTDPFDIGLGFGTITFKKGTQNTAPTAVDPATAKSTLTSTEQLAEIDWSYNLDEDAVIAMMPAFRAALAQYGGEAMDAFILNADATDAATGNINLDDADPDADSYFLSSGQDGIRHQWLVDYTAQGSSAGAAIDDTKMAAGLKLLGKYGLDINNLRIVPDAATYLSMLGMTNVATFEKYGAQATILKGELGRYRGIPILPSASHPLTEADGKVSTTAGNNTKGSMSIYNRNMWRVGFRRGLTIEVDRLIQKRSLVMVVSFRIAVAAQGTRSAAKHTAGIYNITV